MLMFSVVVHNALTETGHGVGALVTCLVVAVRVRVIQVGRARLISHGSIVAMVVCLAASVNHH